MTVANYYYRLKEVRKACLQNIPEREITQSIVPVSENLITSGTGTAIKISVGDFQISVSDTTTPELLKMVLQVAAEQIALKVWFGNRMVICSYIKD